MSGAALLLVAQPGFAADAAGSATSNNLEEVVVTAQKRAERAQDVPISLAVMSGEAPGQLQYSQCGRRAGANAGCCHHSRGG